MSGIEDEEDEYLSQSFDDLNLSEKEISSKLFDDCTFTECDFSQAIFSGCKFTDCRFIKCNLSVVKIKNSSFFDVVFEDCKMIGIDWTKANWSRLALSAPIKFYKCIINDSSFFRLNLKEIVIEECKAHDVDFREGNFSGANFTYTDLLSSLFSQTNLTGADFTESINYDIDVHINKIRKAKFSRYEAVRLLGSLGIELVD
jgi:fluoroquinolone resistance protein